MRRREFIVVVGAAAIAWPLAARAQQRAMPVIGLLHLAEPDTFTHLATAFRDGLGETGYVEGRKRHDRISLGAWAIRSTPLARKGSR